jgi:hypothetical protein
MKKIISFALWGTEHFYLNGAINNIINSKIFYPEWICRFYIDETTVPNTIQETLKSYSNVEVVNMHHAEDVLGMFWRFSPMWDDKDIERFIVRDTDCQPTQREVNAVNEWIESGKPFHIIRDNHYHSISILGGTWGAIPGCIPNMMDSIKSFIENIHVTQSQHKARKYHGADQNFLFQYVWPIIKDNHIAHVRQNEPGLLITGKEILLPELENDGHFIGMPCSVIDGKCIRVESHLIKSNCTKYKEICLMIPTYKRPQKLKELIDSVYDSAYDISNVKFSFCVNVKDEETRLFLNDYFINKNTFEIIDESTMQPNLSYYFNKMYDETKFKNAIVSMIGDDMVFKTKGWDTRILNVINNASGNALVYCDDNFTSHELCAVNLFTTREVITATKKPFMCTEFHADMIDMIWTMVGTMTGISVYLPDIIIQHNHSSKESKEKWDETFQRLSPIQKQANNKTGVKFAVAYSTLCAKNLIESGVGLWNTLK